MIKSIPIKTVMHRIRTARIPWIPALILGFVLFFTVFANLISPYDPNTTNLSIRLQAPAWQQGGSTSFPLGTDTVGRDLLTRIMFGARTSLIVVVLVSLIGGLVGLALGVIAGYFKGFIGAVIMRLVDSLMAIPPILIAIVFAMTLQPSISTVVVAISVVLWARIARVVRGEVLALSESAYIMQAKVAGSSPFRIMVVHIMPNILNTFVILLSLNIGFIILTEASLSFLGAGIPSNIPSWGQMVSEGKGYIASAWWISFFPGLALAITVLGVNMFGDWLRDKLDPKLRQL